MNMHSKSSRSRYLGKDWEKGNKDSELNKMVTQWKSNGERLRKGLHNYCFVIERRSRQEAL